eukprot:522829_1
MGELQNRIDELESQKQIWAEKKEHQSDDVAGLNRQVHELNAEKEALAEQIHELESQKHIWAEKKEHQSDDVAGLNRQVYELNAEKEALAEQVVNLIVERDQHSNSMAALVQIE